MGGIGEWIGGAIKGFFGGANDVVQTLKGSEKERDQQGHDEFINTQKTYSAEFYNRNNRTLWDSFWDGLNRMPRPLFVILIVGYFLLSYVNPEEFQILNIGLATVPEKMWYVLSAIIGFYFCARELHKLRESKGGMALTKAQFKELQDRIESIRKEKKVNLNNPSIEEWKNKTKNQ